MLTDRFIQLVEARVEQKTRYKMLETITSIPKDSWVAVMRRRQRPNVEMIETVAKLWPEYAYWLVTGATEPERGHIAPETYESTYPVRRGVASKWAIAEKHYIQNLLKAVPEDEKGREELLEKIKTEISKLQKTQVIPGIEINYQNILEIQKEDIKNDFFLIECDEEYREIVKKRWLEEKNIMTKLYAERDRMSDSIHFDGIVSNTIQGTKFIIEKFAKKLKETATVLRGASDNKEE